MDHNELDRILSRQDDIVPSSGFAVSVMDAVRQEAAAPPPIAFPWKRALPGLVAAMVTLVLAIVEGVALLRHGSVATQVPSVWTSAVSRIIHTSAGLGAGWIALALLLTWVCVELSMRLALRRG